jgi:hypothetical protein
MRYPRGFYLSLLLRLWPERDESGNWRGCLEELRSGEHRGFASLRDLAALLEQIVGNAKRADGQLEKEDL